MAERQHQTPELLQDTQNLISEVTEATGRRIDIRPDLRIEVHARASFVTSDPDPTRHLIFYNPAHSRFLDHLIAHECGHIMRFGTTPPSERIVPVLTSLGRERTVNKLLPELDRIRKLGVSQDSLGKALPLWMHSVTGQLTSIPADIRIEQWIQGTQAGLRKVQARSLLDQAREAKLMLRPDISLLTPRIIWEASTAMNYAFFKRVAEILDNPSLLKPYRNTPAERLGKELLAIIDESSDGGASGDRLLSELWAQRLGLSGLFDWKKVGTLPHDARRVYETQ